MGYLKEFIESYIECALWSSVDNTDDSGGSLLDENFDADDIAPEAHKQMVKDCVDFVWAHRSLLRASKLSAGSAGRDFWLDRNGHGTGFWDEGEDEVFEELSDACQPCGSCDIYVGDDGKLYVQ